MEPTGLHEAYFLRDFYFSTKKKVVESAQSMPKQENHYLTLRQRGQILGQEIVLPNRGYSARTVTGIQDRVNDLKLPLPSDYGGRNSIPARQNYGDQNRSISLYGNNKKPYGNSVEYLF